MIEIYIVNGSQAFIPEVLEGITLESSRIGEPSTLKFSCVGDDNLKIEEGNAVKMVVDNKNVFFGFIFSLKRSKDNVVQITAYDQLRYLKNKDSYLISNKTASQIVKMIANDFQLNLGTIAETGYILPPKAQDNKTLFDIIKDALNDTLQNTTKMFVLYDDFGKLTLKNAEDMLLNLLIDEETGQSFDYSSSINENTYNKIKLIYDNKGTGKREVFIAKDSSNINKWGVLQYFEALQTPQGASAKAEALLKLYNAKTRNLKVSGAFGDIRVRAGCSVVVKLNLGDIALQNFMLVEKVKHSFSNGLHTMDLNLRGGLINNA